MNGKKALDFVVRELNPLHDFDRVHYLFPSIFSLKGWSVNLKSERNEILPNIYTVVNLAKHVVRGGAIGAAIGGLASFATNSSLPDDVRLGATSGILLDGLQYFARSIWGPTVKEMYSYVAMKYHSLTKKDNNKN